MAKDEKNLHWDDIPKDQGKEREGDVVPDGAENLLEYMGVGKDEEKGPKFMQNADGTWGEAQNAAG